ncbi:MAG: AAA family ATPase [Bifidobacteriaceae bacterium]|nr:AAA family ATPase [Bifidobacteriaceae bacterium]
MLTKVTLAGAPMFAEGSAELDGLARFNFVFGANGTGKTTISRILAGSEAFPSAGLQVTNPTRTIVYNRDYVQVTLREAHQLAGVFTLDAEDPEARAEYRELTGADGVIATAEGAVAAAEPTVKRIAGEIQRIEMTLRDNAWDKRSAMPAELSPMFEGVNASKASFPKRLLSVPKGEPRPLEDLVREALSAFGTVGERMPPLDEIPMPRTAGHLGMALLDTPVVGSGGVSLADLIGRLGNGDWVSQGRQYLGDADGRCPFCQQDLPHGFLEHLGRFFDAEYERQLGELRSLERQIAHEAATMIARLDALDTVDTAFVDVTARGSAAGKLRQLIEANKAAVERKLAEPSSTVLFEDLTEAIADVNQVITKSNELVQAHNTRLGDQGRARTDLASACWTYFAWGLLAEDMTTYAAKAPGAQEALNNADKKLSDAKEELRRAKKRAHELEARLVSSAPTIARINHLLKTVGFTTFRLAASDSVKDGYSLQRPDGTVVEDTLSEGERTFITFLYYFAQLESRAAASGEGDLVAVIDDPVSSLDSDVLFVVTSLIRRLFSIIQSGHGSLKQVIVLTHNAQFYLELTHERAQDRREGLLKGRKYFELRRRGDGGTEILPSDSNSIKSTYGRMWDEVKSAGAVSGLIGIGLENVIRRILEKYFTILGDYSNLDTLVGEFTGDDAIAARSMLSWLHHGSHTLVDDLDYSPSRISYTVYLRVFRAVFERCGQLGHYNMMMGIDVEPVSLPTPE